MVCEGKGRIERYAKIGIGTNDDFNSQSCDYNVLPKSEPITGDRELIGFATSVASSEKLGTTTAIARVNSELIQK